MLPAKLVLALSMIAAATPVSATSEEQMRMGTSPTGTADTRYCMRVAAPTGSHIERVKCWTRDKWAEQGVDVDRDWAEEGVRTIG